MYLRDMCLAGEIELVGCGTAVQVADIHTKGLERTKFQAFRDVMCGYRTYNDLISEDPETVSTVRRIALSLRCSHSAASWVSNAIY